MKNPIYDNQINSFVFNSVTETDNDHVQVHYLDFMYGDNEKVESPTGEIVEVRTISPKVFVKSVHLDRETSLTAVNKISEEANLNREFPKIDARAMKLHSLRNEYTNLLTRKGINKLIELGQKNFEDNLKKDWNSSLLTTSKKVRRESVKVNFWPNPLKWLVSLFKKDYHEVIEETTDNSAHTIQRRLLTKILFASNFIAANGRFGPANVIVINGRIGAMLQDIAQFVYKSDSQVSQVSSMATGLDCIGSIAGIHILVDHTKKWNDTSILVYRLGKSTDPGLHMAYKKNFGENGSGLDVIEITDQEDSKMIVRGCQAIFEVGFKPELQTLLIPIDLPDFCN